MTDNGKQHPVPLPRRVNPDIQRLISSGVLDKVELMLAEKRRVRPFEIPIRPLREWLVGTVSYALAPPDIAETMTTGERSRLAATIIESSQKLSGALARFQDVGGMRWPFQPVFDRFALEMQIFEEERLRESGNPMDEETAHRCRYIVYGLLMHKLDELFQAFIDGAAWFESTETILKKPNDKNADRLYFIRTLNRKFCTEFRAPCRAAVLEITSVYFDCEDLDPAALSKLAPFYRPEPLPMDQETLDFLSEFKASQGDHDFPKRLRAHIEAESKWGMGRESSAE